MLRKTPLVCLLLAVLLPASLMAQTTLPDTPAGRVFGAWLEAFNSGDRARLSAYLKKYEAKGDADIDRMAEFRDQTGGFNVIRVEKSDALHLEALVKERASETHAIAKLEVTDADPPQVEQFGVRVVSRPEGIAAIPRLTLDAAVKALDSQAAAAAAKDRFSGAVLVARDGKVIFEKAYGFADREKHLENSADTQFRLGSMNKMFTATAALQLVAQGKLDLAGTVGRYLPDYPNKDVASKVTIRHLLTHTGGTGDVFTPEYQKKRLEVREPADYVKLFGSRGLQFEPGSKWAYSNYGFVLLGAIVEKVAGMSYYDYVRKHIFEPAGMTATDSLPEQAKVAKRSIGYMRRGVWVSNANTLPWRGSPAGGGYSTVRDLYRFAQALTSGKLVRKDLFEAMTSVQAGGREMPGAGYGFGMGVEESQEFKRFGHGGGAPGMNGELRVYPRTRTVVVVLANLDPPAASRLADFFQERMPAK